MTMSKVQDGGEMPQGGWPDEAVADIAARRDALRQAASLPGAEPRTLIDAALIERDAAIEALGAASPGTAASADIPPNEVLPEAVRTERRLLHAVFQQAPVPLFLLEQDGTIRRANNQAAALLGSPSGYATGKPLTAFVDLPFRAAVQTLLPRAARAGEPPPGRGPGPPPRDPPRAASSRSPPAPRRVGWRRSGRTSRRSARRRRLRATR